MNLRTSQRPNRGGATVVFGQGVTRDELQRTGAWLAVDPGTVADLARWQ